MPQERRNEDEKVDGNESNKEYVVECESEENDFPLESESIPLVRIDKTSFDSQRYHEDSNMQFTSKGLSREKPMSEISTSETSKRETSKSETTLRETSISETSLREAFIPSGECAQGREENMEAIGGEVEETPLLVLTKNLSDSIYDSSFLTESRFGSSVRSPISPGQPQCRICFEPGGDDLIAPCQCKGTQKYVHRSCLDHWRTAKEGFAFANCTECRARFQLRENIPPDRWWRKLKFKIFVARDHVIVFLLVQLVVAALGVLVFTIYGNDIMYDFGYSEQPYAFVTTVVLLLVVVGMLYGFFVAVICGERINDRHYHILQKQALTLEFVVEDLEKVGESQRLDIQPCHMKELKSLGLL